MKLITRIVVLKLCFVLWACGLQTSVFTVPGRLDPGNKLFSRAEKLFQAEYYEEALTAYNEYLSRFPDGSLAGGALLKIGAIHVLAGEYSKARQVYKQIINEYPSSSFVLDAQVAILSSFYSEGRYVEVIEQAAVFLAKSTSRVHILRTHVILGNTYLAIGSPIDAVVSYTSAFEKARDSEKDGIIVRFNESASQLSSADIIFLLGRMEDEFPAGYLMYHLGNNYAEEAKCADAVRMLSAFIEKFPRHAKIGEAKELIQAIGKKSVYSRYTIGCLLPLSGRYRTYGNRALKGVELALNRFSSQNPDSAIKIIIKDTGSGPDKAVLAVQELFKENVAAIIGPLVTAETAALEAQNSGIPIITLTQKEDIAQIGDYVFRNFFTPKMQVKTIVSFAVEKLGLDSFAILYPDENYGTTFMNLFWDEVLAQGGRIVGVESYKSSQTDFADPIKKLVGLYYEVPEDLKAAMVTTDDESDYIASKDLLGVDLQFTSKVAYDEEQEDLDQLEDQTEETDQQEDQEAKTDQQEDQATEDDEQEEKEEEPEPIIDFDAVFTPDEPKKSGLIIPQLAFYDVRETYLLGTNLWHSGTLIEMARQYAQGAIMTDGFFAQSTSEPVKNFVRNFEETFSEKPEFIEAVAYDTAMMLFELVNRPEILFRSVLKEELVKLKDYEGVTGLTSFDESGDVRKKLNLIQIKGKGFVELEQR